METSAQMTIQALNIKQGQNALLCMSPTFIAGKMMIVRALSNNMSICAIEPQANPYLPLSTKIHFSAMTPMQMHTALEHKESVDRVGLTDIIILGGGSVSEPLRKKIQGMSPAVYETYGMTETVSHVAIKPLNGPEASDYFQCLDNITIRTDDRQCLVVSGPVTDYKEVTTNDRVKIIANNRFQWLGRVDNVINSGGIKIQSELVEQKIQQLIDQLQLDVDFFVSGIPDNILSEKVTLFVESADILDTDKLLSLLKTQLNTYEVPREVITVKSFARTQTGKIQRQQSIQKALNQ